MIEYADKRVHPTVNVTFHRNHDLRLDKFARDGRIPRSLAVVPCAIDLGHGMNVVGHRI